MDKFVKFFKIDTLEHIQQELKSFANSFGLNDEQSAKGFNITPQIAKTKLPILDDWLNKTYNTYPVALKFYITPPHKTMHPHIDGNSINPFPFGINIPVENCSESETFFYACDKDNIREHNVGSVTSRIPLDKTKLTLLKSYVIDKPCWINTSVMHSMKNYSKKSRTMFLIRWGVFIKTHKEILK